MFDKQTKQGWEIISTIKLNVTHIVFKRPQGDYGWAYHYDTDKGTWAQGHYDYKSPESALQDLIESILGKIMIPYGEKSFRAEIEGYGKQLANEDIAYQRTPIDNYEEFLREFNQHYRQKFIEGYKAYLEERERLVDID